MWEVDSTILCSGDCFNNLIADVEIMERTWSLYLVLLLVLPLDGKAQLNDTGITTCGDYAYDGSSMHDNTVDCSRITDDQGDLVPPGQDGHYGRDATNNASFDGRAGFSFTKIDANGNHLAASAIIWSCVRDNVTGLVWEVKTDDGGLRDKDWTYTWFSQELQILWGGAGTSNGGTCVDLVNCDTEKFMEQVNATELCGFDDWRLPRIDELRSIVDYSVPLPGPAIDIGWFPNTLSSSYWSASPAASLGPKHMRYLSFNRGSYGAGSDSSARRVRLVRGGE